MIRISLRHKIALELYATISLFAATIILLYYSLFDRIGNKYYLPAVGTIGLCLISFIFFLRTLILDVNLNRYTPQLCCGWDKAFQLQPHRSTES